MIWRFCSYKDKFIQKNQAPGCLVKEYFNLENSFLYFVGSIITTIIVSILIEHVRKIAHGDTAIVLMFTRKANTGLEKSVV